MLRSSAKPVILIAVVGATLVAALFLFLNFGDRADPFVGRPVAEANSGNQPGNRPLDSSNQERGNHNRGGNDIGATPNNSEPKQNSPACGGEPDPASDPVWSPIERLPNLDHQLYTVPTWNENVSPESAPEDHGEEFFNFAVSAKWRWDINTRHKYNPRTTYDAAVELDVDFYADAPTTGRSDISTEWVEVRSSLSGNGWRFAPKQGGKRKFEDLHVIVPVSPREILLVKAKRSDGVFGEALVTDMGLGSGNYNERKDLNDNGKVSVRLEPLETLEAYASCVIGVTDPEGVPVADALILYRSQILGRTDQTGTVNVKVPEYRGTETVSRHMDGTSTHYIYVWKTGYAPIVVDRRELKNEGWNANVKLSARELLVRIPDVDVPSECLVRDDQSGSSLFHMDLVGASCWVN